MLKSFLKRKSRTVQNKEKIFISYRRADSAGRAGRLYDYLVDIFGEDRVFMDVTSIQGGEDFFQAIQVALEECGTVLCVIGPKWLTIADSDGNARLEKPQDYVRIEVELSLQRDISVIPVLVNDVEMPRQNELPDTIGELSKLNAFILSDFRWRSDIEQLVQAIRLKGPKSRTEKLFLLTQNLLFILLSCIVALSISYSTLVIYSLSSEVSFNSYSLSRDLIYLLLDYLNYLIIILPIFTLSLTPLYARLVSKQTKLYLYISISLMAIGVFLSATEQQAWVALTSSIGGFLLSKCESRS